MSAPDFTGSATFSVDLVRRSKRGYRREVTPIARGLSLVEYTRLVYSLDVDLVVDVTIAIWPHEDSSADLAEWIERDLRVSVLRGGW